MKRFTVFVVAIVLFVSVISSASAKKRVAVLDFDFSAVQKWWDNNWDVGNGVSDLIVKNLVRDGTFSVIERRALDAVLAEQNFSNSDRASASTAAQIGKVLGVDAIIVGSITQFGTENKSLGIGGLAGKWGGFGAGKVGTSKGKAVVAIDARVIDVNTAEILAVADAKAESSRSGLLLGGFGAGGGGFGGGSIDMGSSDFRETILGEAVHGAAEDLTAELIAADSRIPVTERVISGLIAYADSGLIIVNVGSSHGVTEGMELSVERIVNTIKDPATGKVLRELTDTVARIRVTKVDEGSSEATLVSGSGEIAVGDVVKTP
ncbi:MAG: curli production assembly protein CsgG [Acidobacteriota bacterium]|nr:MAG: curli production assembly protein CsgG [Acidobacteriota bacterium]